MENTLILLEIIKLAHSINNSEIEKEAVSALARQNGLVVDRDMPKRLEDIVLYSPVERGKVIPAIRELRARADEAGLVCGLKEAKDEIERRLHDSSDNS